MTTITEADLKLRAARWRNVFDALPPSYFCFLLTREGVYLDLRYPSSKRLWQTEQNHFGKRIEDVLPPELGKWRRLYFDEAIASGKVQIYAYPHPFDGRKKYYECEITPLPNPETQEINEALVIVRDVIVAPVPEAFVLRYAQ